MKGHIHTFELTHNELKNYVDNIHSTDFKTKEGQSVLIAGKHFILSHFSRISHEHCPSLCKYAESKNQLARVMNIFSADMQLIQQALRDFFTLHEDMEYSIDSAPEYGRVYALMVHSVCKQSKIISMLHRTADEHNFRRSFEQAI